MTKRWEAKRWEVTTSHSTLKRLGDLLDKGWEPFAAYYDPGRTINGNGLHVVLRRRKR